MIELVLVKDEHNTNFVVLKEKLQDFLNEAEKSGDDVKKYEIREFSLYKENYYEQI